MKNKFIISTLIALSLIGSLVSCSNTEKANTSNSESTASSDAKEINYVYGYAPLSYAEYWAADLGTSVEKLSMSSETTDSEGNKDTGMFDAVSRATTKHGIYRSQIQYTVEVTGEKVLSTETVEENGREQTKYTTDSNDTKKVTAKVDFTGVDEENNLKLESVDDSILFKDGAATFTIKEGDSATEYKIVNYDVAGFNKIPVAIPSDMIEDAKSHGFVEDDSVTADSYGLKTMEADGSYSKRNVSGKASSDITVVADEEKITYVYNTRFGSDAEAYIYLKNKSGEDLTDAEALEYFANFITAKYEYYGDDSTYSNLVATFGTKHAADTWWSTNHGARIDCGINYSFDRFKGANAGYYKITLIANGYEDVEAKVCFKEAYPNEVTAILANNTLSLSNIDEDLLAKSKLTITSGSGKDTVKVVENADINSTTYNIEPALEAGKEYNISITLEDYQPLTFTITAE